MRSNKRKTLFLFLLIFFFSLRVVFDPDLGLHLRIGEEVFKTKSPIFGNPFGLYFRDYPYIYHSWLSQLIIFLIHKSFGLYGLSFFYAILSTLTMFILHKICIEKVKTKNQLLFLVFLTPLIIFVSGLRIRAVTFLFLAILYLLLLKIEKGEKRVAFLIPPLFTLWTNLHGGFLMGLIFLLLWSVSEMVQFKLPNKAFFPFKLLVLSFLFSLLNPYGIGVYTQPLRMIGMPILFKLNLDWQPLSSEFTSLFLCLFFVILIFFFKEKVSSKDQFLFFSLFFLTIFISRFFLMLILVFLPLLVQIFAFVKTRRWFKDAVRSPLVLLSLLVFLLSVFLKQSFQIGKMVWAYQSIENYASSLNPPLPFKATKFIKERRVPERTLNDFNWGSFLLWQLPKRKIFVDGRMDTFVIKGKPFLIDYWKMIAAEEDWERLLEKYQIEAVFLSKTYPLAKILPLLPRWKKLYEDDLSLVLIKE